MKTELLAPAGSFHALTAAVQSGADAVYLGGDLFSARQGAANFTIEEMKRAVDYCHMYGVKVYAAVNTLIKEKELEQLVSYIEEITKIDVDAVIVQDMGAVQLFRQISPDMPLHASTQMTVTTADGVRALEKLGFERVVLARELSERAVAQICRETKAEIEVFCHGALCMCYSGQCLMSSIIGGRSGNRGRCAQPCRLPYTLLENGEPVANGHLLSTKDLSLINKLDSLKNIGVSSLKIEGRLKKPEYVAAVVGIYRKYLDSGENVREADKQELLSAFNRSGLTEGYFSSQTGKMMMSLKTPSNVADELFSADVQRRAREDADVRKINISVSFTLHSDDVCRVTASDGVHTVCTHGTQKSESAINRPLDAERVRTQLLKTGGTPFTVCDTSIIIDDGITVPVSEINSVRRAAADALITARQTMPERRICDYSKQLIHKTYDEDIALTVQAETAEQLRAISKFSVDTLYVPASLYSETLQMFPDTNVVLRLSELDDGNIISGVPAVMAQCLSQTRSYADRRVYGGFRLNIYNSEAARFYENLVSVTLSPELNLREIQELTENADITAETIVYGRLPLMMMKNCPIKASCGKCQKKTQKYSLRDRRGEIFPLICGDECISILLNSKPIFMADKVEDLRRAKINRIRLVFTVENFSECGKIMNVYERAFSGEAVQNPFSESGFTRGHYYRGVL
jgi:putative protease